MIHTSDGLCFTPSLAVLVNLDQNITIFVLDFLPYDIHGKTFFFFIKRNRQRFFLVFTEETRLNFHFIYRSGEILFFSAGVHGVLGGTTPNARE
jgi:hypothetical protein